MEIQRILDRVKIMTGDDRDTLLVVLCTDAVRMLEDRLCCTAEEKQKHAEALAAAAAAEVLLQLVLIDAAQSPDRLTAGSVRAEFNAACDRAEAYRKSCMRAVSHLLRDDSFFFGEVTGCE